MENSISNICRLCLDIIEIESLECLIEIEMLEVCLPEIDLNFSNNPVICKTCDEKLKQFYSFKSKCLETEDKIINFKVKNEIEVVNLSSIINSIDEGKNTGFRLEREVKVEPECSSNESIKIENTINPDEIEDEQLFCVDIRNVKEEQESNETFQFVNCGLVVKEEVVETQNTTNLENETLQWHTCGICSYKTKWRHHVKRHRQIHEAETNPTKIFKCLKCGFISNYKHALHKHSVLEHGNWFKCEHCDYQTKWKRMYNQHILTHQGGQLWHHCQQCSYKTKWKYHLRRHMAIHE